MGRYAYLNLLFSDPIYSLLIVSALVITALLAWTSAFRLSPALLVPLYMPVCIAVSTASLLVANQLISPENYIYVLIVSALAIFMLSRAFNELLIPAFRRLFEALAYKTALQTMLICSVISFAHSITVFSASGAADASSRIAYLYVDSMQRLMTPFVAIVNAILFGLMCYFLYRGKLLPALTGFVIMLFGTLASQSKGASFVSLISVFFLVKSLGVDPFESILLRLPFKQKRSIIFKLAITSVGLISFAILFTVFTLLRGLELNAISERLLQNADSIFMYFGDDVNLSERVCRDLGYIAPLHRGLAGLLGNDLAKDPSTIFGIALNSAVDNFASSNLEGPNAQLPSWSHCYYGYPLGLAVSATLTLLYYLLCSIRLNFRSHQVFALAWFFTLYSAASFYQEVAGLTSVIAQLIIIALFFIVFSTLRNGNP